MSIPQIIDETPVTPRYAEFWYKLEITNTDPIFIGRILELKIGERLIRAVQGVRLSNEHQRLIGIRAYKDLFSDDGETVGFLQRIVLSRVQTLTLEEVIAPFPAEPPLHTPGVRTLSDDLAKFAGNIDVALYGPEVEKIFEKLPAVEVELTPL